MRETWFQSLGQEDPLEKEMATHSSILAWRIPWTEEPGRLQSMGSQRVGHDWATSLSFTFNSYVTGHTQYYRIHISLNLSQCSKERNKGYPHFTMEMLALSHTATTTAKVWVLPKSFVQNPCPCQGTILFLKHFKSCCSLMPEPCTAPGSLQWILTDWVKVKLPVKQTEKLKMQNTSP